MIDMPLLGVLPLVNLLVGFWALLLTGAYGCRVRLLNLRKHRWDHAAMHYFGMATVGLTCFGCLRGVLVDMHDVVAVLLAGMHIVTTFRLWLEAKKGQVPAYMFASPAVQAPQAQKTGPRILARSGAGRRETDR